VATGGFYQDVEVLLVDHPEGKVAVAQPAHAWISGQLARAWGNERFGQVHPWEEVCLAAEQHDVAWLEWERQPTIDPETGYPHTFMSLDMPTKLALWADGPDVLLGQSRYAALLVSLHGSRLYRELDRGAFEREVRATLDAPDEEIERNRRLVWAWDNLSLALLLDWAPHTVEQVPGARELIDVHLSQEGRLEPWPFSTDRVELRCDGRLLTSPGAELHQAPWVELTYELTQ